MKAVLKRLARQSGWHLSNVGRLGLDVDLDLARLSASAPLSTIFDVGGNFGQTACRFAKAFPSAAIYSFEPVPESFSRLVSAVKSMSQVRAFNVALGESAGMAQINIAAHAGSNSMRALASTTGSVTVPVDTLDRFADANNVRTVDLLKIDVEGFEMPVLNGASKRLSEGSIRFVYAECVFSPNDEMPHTSFFDIHNLLDRHGFSFVGYHAESFNLRLGCASGNVLYALRKALPKYASGKVHNIV